MGINTISEIGITNPVKAIGSLVDQYRTALTTDFVPRNASAVAMDNAGSLGDGTYNWNNAYLNGTLTFSTNTISDGNFTGNWAFNASTITGITALTATTLTGTLSTAAQTNITSLGTLTGLQTSGNVGIGRAATVNLDVYKATGFVEFFLEGADTAEGVSSTFKNDNSKSISIACFGSTNSGSYDGLSYADATRISTNGNFLLLAQNGNTPIYFGTNSNVRMSIDGSGNVVINDGNLTLSTGSFIGAISGNTTVTQTSGDLTFNLNNDSHGDNSILQFNAENAGGTNKTCNVTFDPDTDDLNLDKNLDITGSLYAESTFHQFLNETASTITLRIYNTGNGFDSILQFLADTDGGVQKTGNITFDPDNDYFNFDKNIYESSVRVTTSDGDTGGSASAGSGNQYIEITCAGTTYKVLHDGTV